MTASTDEEFIRIAFTLSFDRFARIRLDGDRDDLELSDYHASWMLVRVIHDGLLHREAAAGISSESELQARHREYAGDEELIRLLISWPAIRRELQKDPPREP